MKVTHTVFRIESDEEKRILAQALAKELIKNESVMVEEAGSNELPQYIPYPDDEPCECSNFAGDTLKPIETANITPMKLIPVLSENGPVNGLRSYIHRHKDSDLETPVYVSEVPCDGEDAEAKKAAVIALMKAMTQANEEEDKKEAVRNFIRNISNRQVDEDHIFTCEDGRQVAVPESLIYHIKNNL